MKKMFTLLVGLVTFSALFAQYNKPYDNRRADNRNYDNNSGGYGNRDRNKNDNNGGYSNNDQRWNNNGGSYQKDDPCINNNDPNYRPDRAVDMRRADMGWRGNDRMNDGDRRVEMDRVNRDYDRRVDACRNDRGMNDWQRKREMDRLKQERNARLKNFGGGIILGGLLGVLIGSHL